MGNEFARKNMWDSEYRPEQLFTREIKSAENKTNKWGIWYICFWNYSDNNTNYNGLNPIIDKYFHFVFYE